MTLEELNEYLSLRQQLARDKEILLSLETRAAPGAQNLTGMPHTPGVVAKVEIFAVEIANFKSHIQGLEEEIAEQQKKIETFIAGISPDWVQLPFRLRYLRALPWKTVAEVMGGGNTEESIKRMCYRYLNRNESCPAMSRGVP